MHLKTGHRLQSWQRRPTDN